MIRSAVLGDVPFLVDLEQSSFAADRLTYRQFRYMLMRAKALTLVAELDGEIVGYVLVIFPRGGRVARIYSIAVSHKARSRGVGSALVDAAERRSLDIGRSLMKLEIRIDNHPSQKLFHRAGYKEIRIVADYYEDRAPAIRYEKSLVRYEPANVEHESRI